MPAIFVVSLVSSPGAGKTALLEATARLLGGRRRLGAVAGDLETHNDAERLRAAGISSTAITTGSACHLDAKMVHQALHGFPWSALDYLFIENVGNLVCPAVYDLGEAAAWCLSVTEGEDKPLKYPTIFHTADVALITKIDLAEAVGFDASAAHRSIQSVRPGMETFEVSARSGRGMDGWLAYLHARRATGKVMVPDDGRS